MKERPILFSGQMVRAVLEGRKTQTRRVVKPQPILWYPDENPFHRVYEWKAGRFALEAYPNNSTILGYCPYGKVGDQLWVREKWATIRDEDECSISDITEMNKQGPPSLFFCNTADHSAGKWRPSIHMPRWVCRLKLEVTEVRIQHLHDVSEQDCRAEGFPFHPLDSSPLANLDVKDWFEALWDSINGDRETCAWADNPWVWALSFRVIEGASEEQLPASTESKESA